MFHGRLEHDRQLEATESEHMAKRKSARKSKGLTESRASLNTMRSRWCSFIIINGADSDAVRCCLCCWIRSISSPRSDDHKLLNIPSRLVPLSLRVLKVARPISLIKSSNCYSWDFVSLRGNRVGIGMRWFPRDSNAAVIQKIDCDTQKRLSLIDHT